MNYETYHIPANFSDAGRILGLFEIRNAVEAVILGAPVIFLCAYFLPLALTAKIIVTLILFIPLAGFALIGINDDSLSRCLSARLRWRKNKRILTFRGEINYGEFERTHIRRKNRGA